MSLPIQTRAYNRGLDALGANMSFRDQGLSPAAGTSIWELCPQLASLDPAVGFGFFDDFVTLAVDDTTSNPSGCLFSSDTATGGITLLKAAGGVLNVACGDTDNNETYLQFGAYGSATAAPFVITNAGGKPVFFEARIAAGQHADMGAFIGLAEEASAAANFLVDNTGAVADKDFIGFNILAATPAAWNVTWRKAGQTTQVVTGAAVNADDYHIFSFLFDGTSTVYFYVDRVLVSTQALASATTFPSAQALAPIIGVKTGEAVAKSLQLDYLKVWQAR